MKKLILILTAAVTVSFVGCKTIPDAEQVESLSVSIGAASGTVCKMSITNDITLNVICDVISNVCEVIPDTNFTCVATWKPIITNIVDKVYQEGKINDDEVEIITNISLAAAHGVDWMFKVHPKWKQYSDISVVAVKGFSKGFLIVVEKKAFSSSSNNTIIIDELAYSYFLSISK